MILGALRSALSAKLADAKLTIVDAWKLDSHKTKPFRQALDKINGDSRTILLVETGANLNLERASRNLDGVSLVPSTALEPYDLLRHDHLVLSRDAAAKLSRALSATKAEAPVEIESARSASEPPSEPVEAEPAAKPAARARKKPAAKKQKAKAKSKPKGKRK
jgi:Ribosomal protein L4/L1 family